MGCCGRGRDRRPVMVVVASGSGRYEGGGCDSGFISSATSAMSCCYSMQ